MEYIFAVSDKCANSFSHVTDMTWELIPFWY
jgi:hypothetical protein